MRERNDHHFWYPRNDYHGKPFNHLRGLVIAKSVLIEPHRELHANLDPPPRPNAPLAHNIVDYLSDQRFNQPLDSAFHVIDYCVKVGNPETLAIAEHIGQQIGYLIGGVYE